MAIVLLSVFTAVSPVCAEELSFILGWYSIAYQLDLDAHLEGPEANGGVFHVYYGNWRSEDERVRLNTDSLTGSDPEIIAAGSGDGPITPGVYRYWVQRYSGNIDFLNAEADIYVDVRQGNTLIGSFRPGPESLIEEGNWHVLEMTVSPDGRVALTPLVRSAGDDGLIDIPDIQAGCGETVVVPVRIQNAPNTVTAMGFDVVFDPQVFSYTGFEKGALVPAGYQFDVSFVPPNILRCGSHQNGTGQAILPGVSGEVVRLMLDAAGDCDSSLIELNNLKDHIAGWSASPGYFSKRRGRCGGDINGNGQITPADALAAFEKYMLVCPTSDGLDCNDVCCDVNTDGNCTPADALCVFYAYLERPNCLDGVDTVPPVITPIGNHPQHYCLGGDFRLPEAVAIDDVDGEIPVAVDSNINTQAIGEYQIRFLAVDSSGNAAESVSTIHVIQCGDAIAPIVTMPRIDPVCKGDTSFTLPEVTAVDNMEGYIPAEVFSDIDINTVGTYQIVAVARDSAGNEATAATEVEVVDCSAPLNISLEIESATVPPGGGTPLRATVRDSDGNPVENVLVRFSLPTGGGEITASETASTDLSGIASSVFTAGSSDGLSVSVRASILNSFPEVMVEESVVIQARSL